MTALETIAKEDLKDLVKVTKEEQKTRRNNESLPEVYNSYNLTMLSQYLDILRSDYYDIDKYTCLLDDIRYYEEENPVVERVHMNIETSMHNRIMQDIDTKTQVFKDMMKDYYIIHDVECDLIDIFSDLIQKHIDASTGNDVSVAYLTTLAKIRDNIDFKYSSNIDTLGIGMNMTDEEVYDKECYYLENMIIRCMYEIANYKNEDFINDEIYAKVNALAIYLQSALVRVEDKRHVDEYHKLSNQIPLDTTAKGIVNTAFVQEKALQKKLVKDDEHGM